MRVLSLRQPFASLIVAGVKRYECRSWYPTALGPLAIHASSGFAHHWREISADPVIKKALAEAEIEDATALPRGAILGFVTVAKVYLPEHPPKRLSKMDEAMLGAWHGLSLWRLTRPFALATAVPCKGALNLWSPPEAVAKAVLKEL